MSSTTMAPAGSFDRFFRLSGRGSSFKQEVVAGATTFAAMAYIIAGGGADGPDQRHRMGLGAVFIAFFVVTTALM